MKDTFFEIGTEVFDWIGERVNDVCFKADEILDILFIDDIEKR